MTPASRNTFDFVNPKMALFSQTSTIRSSGRV